MRERPILFSAPMVRALLAGTKTQTRRAMRCQPGLEATVHVEHFHQTVVDRHGEDQPGPEIFGAWWDDGESGMRCPYGAPGDHLYVRETWMDLLGTGIERKTGDPGRYAYAADTPPGSYGDEARKTYGLKWKPSIHMPRWASRILLEVTEVRVQRLQDISGNDVIAEGCEFPDGEGIARGQIRARWLPYRKLWESINGPGSWDANPWVWVIEFRKAAS
jgi:hypothetical protein